MHVKDIRILLEKLDELCVKTLERAVGSCVNRGHYEVRWEHLFIEFIDEAGSDIPLILQRFNIDIGALRKGLAAELETLRIGNTGKPTFSPPLLDAVEQAWSLASLTYGIGKITSGTLFVAAFEKASFGMVAWADALRSVNLDTLKAELLKITAGSQESSGAAPQDAGAKTGPAGGAMTPEASTEILRKYCANFTDLAKAGKIDPILGRDDEIRQALDILSRRRKNNPIMVGEAGVGKTAVVEGMALRIAAGDVPEHLKGVDLWALDLGLLQAGASVKGEFEKRLKGVIDAIKSSATPNILFIDEAHTLVGAGGAAGQNDAANLLKPALARGELRTLAATTWAEYRKYFEKDPALTRRFQPIVIEEPNEETCSIMLRGVASSYEKHHGVTITFGGIKAAVEYSHRYISGRQLPDKAVDVLDTACTRVKMSRTAKPGALDAKERSLANANAKLAALERDLAAGISISEEDHVACKETIAKLETEIKALQEKWTKEKELVAVFDEARAKLKEATDKKESEAETGALKKAVDEALDKLTAAQGEEPMVFPYVSAPVCAQVIADWTGIPIGSLVKDEAKSLLELEERLGERVVGQEGAVHALADVLRAAKTGMTNPDAPLGVFLFTGPSGVGKTELALSLADILFGGDKFLTTINMTEYQEKHTVSQLKGSPPGYVGYGEGGILTEAVRQKPYSIVLLDEVEKAHLEVMNIFYQVFDKGFMRDGEGREINFRNTVIIMTSNLATNEIVELCGQENPPDDKELAEAIKPALLAHFAPALVGRCTVVPFRPLGQEALAGIVALKLDKIAKRIHDIHKIAFSCSPSLVQQIVDACSSVETGARNAQAIIDRSIMPGVSRQLLLHLGEEGKKYTRVHISPAEDGSFEIIFGEEGDMEPQEAAPAEEKTEKKEKKKGGKGKKEAKEGEDEVKA
jgi:type VI secretion system protein VasG